MLIVMDGVDDDANVSAVVYDILQATATRTPTAAAASSSTAEAADAETAAMTNATVVITTSQREYKYSSGVLWEQADLACVYQHTLKNNKVVLSDLLRVVSHTHTLCWQRGRTRIS